MKYILLAFFLSSSLLISAQNVGIGNTSPASKLDVSGDISLREGAAIPVVAGINRLTLPASKNSVYRLTGATGIFTISAVSGGNDGMLLTLINSTGQTMTIRDTTGIRTGINADLVGSNTVSVVSMLYNATLGKWIVTGAEGFNSSAAAGWNLSGNTGTTSSNYIGTSDNNPLYIKTNGIQVAYLPASPTDNIMVGKGTTPTGISNVILGSGNHSLMSANDNIAVGLSAMGGTVSGSDNIAIGGSVMSNGTSGHSNIGIGLNSQIGLTAGSFNTAIGQGTLFSNNTGGNNIAMGQDALRNNVSGSDNVALGNGAGDSTLGANNVFLGYNAGYKEKGSNKLYIDNSNTTTPLIYGDFTNNHITINDSLTAKYLQLTSGAANGYILQSDANGNTKWTNPASLVGSGWNTTGNSGTTSSSFIGTTDNNPLYFKTNNTLAAYLPASYTDNILVGLGSLPTGFYNVSIGNNAGGGSTSSGSANVAIGSSALLSNTTGYNNIALGNAAAAFTTTGTDNIAIGDACLNANMGGSGNIVMGTASLSYNQTGSDNISIGYLSGYNNVGNNNIFLGTNAGYSESGSNKLYIDNNSGNPTPLVYGDFSSRHLTINDYLTAKYLQITNGAANGYVLQSDASGNAAWVNPAAITGAAVSNASSANTLTTTVNGVTGSGVNMVNSNNLSLSGTSVTSAVNGVASSPLDLSGTFWTTTGNSGTTSANFIGTTDANPIYFKTNGAQVGFLPAGTPGNISFGVGSGSVTGANNITIGQGSGGTTTGSDNIAIGSSALGGNQTGMNNVAIGLQTMIHNNSGTDNTAVGPSASSGNTTGNFNAAFGNAALRDNDIGSQNTAVGATALQSGNGSQNVAVGTAAGVNSTGSHNVFLGFAAGSNEAGSNKLYIATSNTSTPLVYGDFTNKHLTVNDSLTAKYLQITNGASNGYVLKSDANGNAAWVNPNTITTANTISSSGNTITSTVNGVAATASEVNSNALSLSGTSITSTVNGVASSALDISSIDKNIYNADGTLTGNRTVTMSGNTLGFNGGSVAIGAASATQKLEVTGNTLLGISDNTAMGIDAQAGARLGFVKKFGFNPEITSASGSPIIFSQTNQADIFTNISTATLTERMRIDAGGNVGIGNSSPSYKLDVTGDIHTSTNLTVSGTTNLAGGWASQSITPNGYARMGTLLMQWGTVSYTSNTAVTITFPLGFTSLYSITTTVDAGNSTGSGCNVPVKVMNSGTTTFQIGGQASFSGDAVTKIRWMAIGN